MCSILGSRSPILIVLFCLHLFTNSLAAATQPPIEWVETVSTIQHDHIFASYEEADGSLYLVGYVGVGGQIGEFTSTQNAFYIAKYSPLREVLWLESFNAEAPGLHADLLVTSNSVAAYLSTSSPTLQIPNNPNSFSAGLVSLSRETGQLRWSTGLANPTSFSAAIIPSNLAVDAQGNTYTLISFTSAALEGTVITQADSEILLIKYDSAGKLIWFRKAGSARDDYAHALTIDKTGNIYIGGAIGGNASFSGQTVTTTGTHSAFVAKYDSTGTCLWARTIGSSQTDGASITKLLAHPTLGVIASYEIYDLYTRIYQIGDLDDIVWMSIVGSYKVNSMTPQGQDFIFSATFKGTIRLGGQTFTSRGEEDILVVAFAGNSFVWSSQIGLEGPDQAYKATTSKKDAGIIQSGSFLNEALFDDKKISGFGGYEGFIAKIAEVGGLPVISTQPLTQTNYFGTAVTLSVSAKSATAATYQWYRNGVAIPGQTSPTLNFDPINAQRVGDYYVEITNRRGTVRSSTATLSLRGFEEVTVTTIAGTGEAGYLDSASGDAAQFNYPQGVDVLPDGSFLVADTRNQVIRVISPGGSVGTFAGIPTPGLRNGPGSIAQFRSPMGVAVDQRGHAFVSDYDNNLIRKVNDYGTREVSTYAGSGLAGWEDGPANLSSFSEPTVLALDLKGNLLVANPGSATLRKVSPEGVVTTIAGRPHQRGSQDGLGTNATLFGPAGITFSPDGNFYFTQSNLIRRMSPEGMVETISDPRRRGFVDGPLNIAEFAGLNDIAADPFGNLYVVDDVNHAVRKITPSGEVITLAGTGQAGFKDGTGLQAQFNHPEGIAWHPSGYLIVTDTWNNRVRKIVWKTPPTNTPPAVVLNLYPGLTILGTAGSTYRIEASEELPAGQLPMWLPVGTTTLTNTIGTWHDPQPATVPKKYYRAIQLN